jgi:hypothetical protein
MPSCTTDPKIYIPVKVWIFVYLSLVHAAYEISPT